MVRFGLTIPTNCAGRWTAVSERHITAAGDAATIVIGAMAALPDDLEAWIDGVMRAESPPGARLHIQGLARRSTACGWPWRLVDAVEVVDEQVRARRLGGFFRFFEYGAIALARFPGATLDPRLATEAVSILATAEPDWSAEVAAIAQLWPATP